MQFNCHRKPCRMLSCVAILCTHLRHRSRQFPSNLPLPPAWSGNRSPLYRSSPKGQHETQARAAAGHRVGAYHRARGSLAFDLLSGIANTGCGTGDVGSLQGNQFVPWFFSDSKKQAGAEAPAVFESGKGLYLPGQLAAQDARQAEDARTEQQNAAGLRNAPGCCHCR